MIKVYYSQLNSNYYTTDSLKCECCRKNIERIARHVAAWNRRKSACFTFCQGCYSRLGGKVTGIVTERKVVMIVPTLPEDAVPVFDNPPVLKDSELSLADAASNKLAPADKVIDRTVYAGRESFDGLKIGAPDMKLLSAKDRKLSTSAGLSLLESLTEVSDKQ